MSSLKFLIRLLLKEAAIEMFLENSCTFYDRQIVLVNIILLRSLVDCGNRFRTIVIDNRCLFNRPPGSAKNYHTRSLEVFVPLPTVNCERRSTVKSNSTIILTISHEDIQVIYLITY